MNKLTQTQVNNNISPFDSIKHIDNQGNEFWCARELQVLLNYKQWQKFNDVIEIAKENIETLDLKVFHHFTRRDNMVKRSQGGGRKKLDYRLTRLACYHIALCCDSRGNDNVKSAKHYFAVKTREAEVVIPQQNEELEKLRLLAEIGRNDRYLLDTRKNIADIHGLNVLAQLEGREVIEVEKQTIEVVDNISGNNHRIMTAANLKKYVKKNTGQNLKSKKQFIDFLKKEGRDDLLVAVRRQQTTEDIDADKIDEAIALYCKNRQMLIGE